jgi:hypothetical protein
MMTALKTFSAWRAEIEEALAVAQAELEAATTAAQACESAAAEAAHERRNLADALIRLGHRPMANALAARHRRHQDALAQAEGDLIRARNSVRSILYRIEDYREGLQQLDQVTTPSHPPALEADDAALASVE